MFGEVHTIGRHYVFQTDCFFFETVACRKQISNEVRDPGILFAEGLECRFANVSQSQCFLQERADVNVIVRPHAVVGRAAAAVEQEPRDRRAKEKFFSQHIQDRFKRRDDGGE